jgi:hypothetical protein
VFAKTFLPRTFTEFAAKAIGCQRTHIIVNGC